MISTLEESTKQQLNDFGEQIKDLV